MSLKVNLLNAGCRCGRSPRAQDPRTVFIGHDRSDIFWSLHKRVMAAVNRWRLDFSAPPPAERLPFAELLPTIRQYGELVRNRLTANRAEYQRNYTGIPDADQLIKESLHPQAFASYLKAQIIYPLKDLYTAGSGLNFKDLLHLIKQIDAALDDR